MDRRGRLLLFGGVVGLVIAGFVGLRPIPMPAELAPYGTCDTPMQALGRHTDTTTEPSFLNESDRATLLAHNHFVLVCRERAKNQLLAGGLLAAGVVVLTLAALLLL